jgi:hypothetical protein
MSTLVGEGMGFEGPTNLTNVRTRTIVDLVLASNPLSVPPSFASVSSNGDRHSAKLRSIAPAMSG